MDKYVAYYGNQVSGIISKDRARQWAEEKISTGRAKKVFITEMVETVEPTFPQITIKPFHPAGVPTHGDRVEARALGNVSPHDLVDGTRDGV